MKANGTLRIISIAIVLLSILGTFIYSFATLKAQNDELCLEVESKVDRDVHQVQMKHIYDTLKRIEEKIDQIIIVEL